MLITTELKRRTFKIVRYRVLFSFYLIRIAKLYHSGRWYYFRTFPDWFVRRCAAFSYAWSSIDAISEEEHDEHTQHTLNMFKAARNEWDLRIERKRRIRSC